MNASDPRLKTVLIQRQKHQSNSLAISTSWKAEKVAKDNNFPEDSEKCEEWTDCYAALKDQLLKIRTLPGELSCVAFGFGCQQQRAPGEFYVLYLRC